MHTFVVAAADAQLGLAECGDLLEADAPAAPHPGRKVAASPSVGSSSRALGMRSVYRRSRQVEMHGRLKMTGSSPVLGLVVVAAVVGALRGGFIDLFVYRYGGRAALDGLPLYGADDPATGLSVHLPAVRRGPMVPLALLPAGWRQGCGPGRRWARSRRSSWWYAGQSADRAGLAGCARGRRGALALEPVWQNLAFGQVNLLLMLAVLVDLVGRNGAGPACWWASRRA